MVYKLLKRTIDIVLSLLGLILFSWLYVIVIIAVKLDDPGPAFFGQKRIGKGKSYFTIWKFRSMSTSTPSDIPTHLLNNPEQYITRVGHILRKSSLDEIPQLWNIFIGDMSFVGPRPALWNQDDLIEEREKYGANDIRPGLAGWAQINGRDELEIVDKARLDGEYSQILKGGGWRAFKMDLKCFFGAAICAVQGRGFIEGGTGALKKETKDNE